MFWLCGPSQMPHPSCVPGKGVSQVEDQSRDEHARLLQAQRVKEAGRRWVGGCSCRWGQWHPSLGFNKASPYTFSKTLDPKFVREVSLATLWVHGFTRPEWLWTKAVFHMAALLPLTAEIYLKSFSKSLRRHSPDCLQRKYRRAISGLNCD